MAGCWGDSWAGGWEEEEEGGTDDSRDGFNLIPTKGAGMISSCSSGMGSGSGRVNLTGRVFLSGEFLFKSPSVSDRIGSDLVLRRMLIIFLLKGRVRSSCL